MGLDATKEKEENDKLVEMKKYLNFTISDEIISVKNLKQLNQKGN
jgi:hypothetical protein